MFEMNRNTYTTTRDMPGGPTILFEDDNDAQMITPYCDANGDVTEGGLIGQVIATVILTGIVAYMLLIF